MASRVTRDHHSLSRNLKLNGNFISNDGENEGISISDDGVVKTSAGDLRQFPSGNTTDYYQIQVASAGATTLRNVDGAGGGSSGHLALFPNGNVGIGVTDPDTDLEIFGTSTQLKLSYDATNYATFATNSSADLAITTVGSGTTDSDISLVADGTIILNSQAAKFKMIAKGVNTEFSVTDSAYAGMILGYTTVGINASHDSYTLTATMTCLDDAMKVKFVAPPSGAVEIFAQIYFDASRRLPVLGLSDQDESTGYQAISFPDAADVTNEHTQAAPPTSLGDSVLRPHWVVTGLTAGTAYEWWFAAKTTGFTGGVLKWGGTATNEYPPFIMKATALPTAVSDYAVYG